RPGLLVVGPAARDRAAQEPGRPAKEGDPRDRRDLVAHGDRLGPPRPHVERRQDGSTLVARSSTTYLGLAVMALAVAFALIRPRGGATTSPSSPSSSSSPSASAKPNDGFALFSGGGGRAVDVSTATRGRVAETVNAPGTIRPGSEVAVGAPFEGRILELAVD